MPTPGAIQPATLVISEIQRNRRFTKRTADSPFSGLPHTGITEPAFDAVSQPFLISRFACLLEEARPCVQLFDVVVGCRAARGRLDKERTYIRLPAMRDQLRHRQT